MLCRQRATAAKVVRALSKTMTTPNGQRQRLFRVVTITFFSVSFLKSDKNLFRNLLAIKAGF
jgi:hypothetical protein